MNPNLYIVSKYISNSRGHPFLYFNLRCISLEIVVKKVTTTPLDIVYRSTLNWIKTLETQFARHQF
jgi:hypothetical protein